MANNGFSIKTNMNLGKISFSPLLDIIKCFYCHNFWHKSYECQLKDNRLSSEKNYRTYGCIQWRKRKEENKVDKCDLVLYAQDQNNKWYMDIGCSIHMTGDKNKFLSLDENKTGNITFSNNEAGRIRGKGIVSLNNGRGKACDVLFVDGIKHNFLSVSQMCNKCCDLLFRAQYCEIRSTTIGKIIAKGVRTENNVYILKEASEE